MYTKYTHKLLALIALMLFSVSLSAEPVLNKPLNFAAEVIGQGDNQKIKLSWDLDSQGESPDYFYLYMAEKNTTDLNEFSLEEEIERDGNKTSYTYNIEDLDESSYSFYMTSFAEIDDEEYESAPTEILHIELQNDLFLEIDKVEQVNLTIGEEWEFEFEYETNADDDDVLFSSVGTLPAGMTLDSDKGEIEWTPADSGVFEIVVYAYLEEHIEVSDTVIVRIKVHGEANKVLHLANIKKQTAELNEEFEYKVKAETNADDDDIRFSLLQSPLGMTIDEKDGEIKWEPDSVGFHVIIVEAHLVNNPAVADTVTFELVVIEDEEPEDAELEIEIEEENIAYLGEELSLLIQVESNVNCPVIFELDGAPEGMVLDSSGTITWTPTETGVVKFWVFAKLECDEKAKDKERITINVKDGGNEQACVVISGNVYDVNDSLVLSGKVKAYRIDKKADAGAYKPSYMTDIENGAYIFELPEGKYTLRVTKEGYKTQWYNKANSIASAEIIEAECDENQTIDFVLEREQEAQDFVVTGSVFRKSDNSGIKAEVKFIPIDWIFDTDKDKPEKAKVEVETDANGAFSATLNSKFEYIAKAEADDDLYLEQYFNQTIDPLEATIISADSNNINVDFYLEEAAGLSNSISGTVYDNENNPIESSVTIYLLGDNKNKVGSFVKNEETNENGQFEFSDLKPGKYILFSLPFENDFVPGYYNENGTTIKQWKEATEIEIEETTVVAAISVTHDPVSGEIGIAEIQGVMAETPGGIIRKGSEIKSTEAIQGAFIYVKDGDKVIEYTFSGNMGQFEFDKLYQGQFSLVADKIGFDSYSEQIEIDYSKDLSMELTVEANPTSVLEYTDNQNDINVFPNPSSKILTVDLSSFEDPKMIYIYNSIGIKVKTIKIEDVSINQIDIDLDNLPIGNYNISVQGEKFVRNSMFNVIR